MNPATLRVQRPGGTVEQFVATNCELVSGVVTATGRWNRSGSLSPDVASYSWPARRVLEIRWGDA